MDKKIIEQMNSGKKRLRSVEMERLLLSPGESHTCELCKEEIRPSVDEVYVCITSRFTDGDIQKVFRHSDCFWRNGRWKFWTVEIPIEDCEYTIYDIALKLSTQECWCEERQEDDHTKVCKLARELASMVSHKEEMSHGPEQPIDRGF